MSNFDKFRELFIEESLEHIKTIKDILEKNQYKKNINELFRHAHSLKGMAATMGFSDIVKITHGLEEFFKVKTTLTNDDIRFILDSISSVKKLIIGENVSSEEIEKIKTKLTQYTGIGDDNQIKENNEENEEIFLPSDNEDKDDIKTIKIEIILDNKEEMLSVQVFKILRSLELYTDILYVNQTENNLKNGIVNNPLIIECTDFPEIDEFKEDISYYEGIEKINIVTEDQEATEETEESGEQYKFNENDYIRIDIKIIDNLLASLNEVFQIKEKLKSHYSEKSEIRELFFSFDKELDKAYDTLLSARLVPLETLKEGLTTLIEKYSSENKQIILDFDSSNLEVDKRILETLLSVMVHIIKNAVDHGIETKEERIKKSKPETGVISIQASKIEKGIEIIISDDGRGIDKKKLKKKVLEKEILDKHALQEFPEELLFDFIFYPGFSTSEQVNEISGRGVGLDSVKKMIENIKGEIAVRSSEDKGTQFILRIPSKLEIMSVLIFKNENYICSVPTTRINKVAEKLNVDIKESKIRNVLKDIFILFKKENFSGGFGIDEIVEIKEELIFNLPDILQHIHGFLGWLIYNNQPVILMDPLTVWKRI